MLYCGFKGVKQGQEIIQKVNKSAIDNRKGEIDMVAQVADVIRAVGEVVKYYLAEQRQSITLQLNCLHPNRDDWTTLIDSLTFGDRL